MVKDSKVEYEYLLTVAQTTAMTASKEQMEITIGPIKTSNRESFCKNLTQVSGLGRIAKGTTFDESYYREICVTQEWWKKLQYTMILEL